MSRKVILYIRWSSGKQRNGTSLERQLEDGRAYCAARGWQIVDEIIEDGRSAFSGAHRNGGDLGVFEAEALQGVHAGITLLCERLDRLSREDPEEGYDFIRALTKAGVSVATIDGDAVYEAGGPLDMLKIITLLIKFQTANEESVKKAERSKSNWKIKHRLAVEEGRPLSRRCPPWLKVVNDQYEVDETKANSLLRMFTMADAGQGSSAICRVFAAENVPLVRGAFWQRERIVEFLRDRRLIGEHVINGEAVKLYPSVIPVDLFERVYANADARKAASTGIRTGKVRNLFAALCRCGVCNGPMKFVGGNKDGGYLRCSKALVGGCASRSKHVAYAAFETAVLDSCLHLALDDNAFTNRAEVARLNVTIAERQRDLKELTEQAKRLWDAAARGSDMAEKLAAEKEAEANQLTANLAALKAQREKAKGRASSLEHMARVADMREHLATDVTLRKRVAQAFQSLITRVWFAEDGTITVMLAGGLKALQIRDGRVIREADTIDFPDSVLHFAGARDRKGKAGALKRIAKTEPQGDEGVALLDTKTGKSLTVGRAAGSSTKEYRKG